MEWEDNMPETLIPASVCQNVVKIAFQSKIKELEDKLHNISIDKTLPSEVLEQNYESRLELIYHRNKLSTILKGLSL